MRKADLEYMHKYLDLFASQITNAPKKPTVADLFQTFKNAFPQCEKNLDFFLGHLSNQCTYPYDQRYFSKFLKHFRKKKFRRPIIDAILCI
jgi:hypothetical protein